MRAALSQPRRQGFSLIELVVVLMIIAILSGLTVSIVGWLRRSADKGTAANVMASLLSNVELYRVTYGNYPDQFDSLIEAGGSNLYDGDTATTDDTGLPSALRSGSEPKLTTLTLSGGDDVSASLAKVGIVTVMDHVAGSGVEKAPGLTGTAPRPLASGGTMAALHGGNAKGRTIIDSIYPPIGGGASGSGVPPEVRLVVVGFGPRCTSVGRTIASPPAYSGVGDPTKIYDRFLCVFACYTDGRRAQLKAVLDTTGDFLSQELAEFHGNKPE